MKLNTLLACTALALSSTLAAADPLSFNFSTQLGTGPFSETYGFSLSEGANFFGRLNATATAADNVSIKSLLLSNGSSQFKYDTLNDGADFDSIVQSVSTTTVKGFTIYSYTSSYAWDPVFLEAGDWTVTVVGSDTSDKFGGTLNLTLVDPPADVPEPGSLALALAALAGLGLVSRRLRS